MDTRLAAGDKPVQPGAALAGHTAIALALRCVGVELRWCTARAGQNVEGTRTAGSASSATRGRAARTMITVCSPSPSQEMTGSSWRKLRGERRGVRRARWGVSTQHRVAGGPFA